MRKEKVLKAILVMCFGFSAKEEAYFHINIEIEASTMPPGRFFHFSIGKLSMFDYPWQRQCQGNVQIFVANI
jgi:hypothetical protein